MIEINLNEGSANIRDRRAGRDVEQLRSLSKTTMNKILGGTNSEAFEVVMLLKNARYISEEAIQLLWDKRDMVQDSLQQKGKS